MFEYITNHCPHCDAPRLALTVQEILDEHIAKKLV